MQQIFVERRQFKSYSCRDEQHHKETLSPAQPDHPDERPLSDDHIHSAGDTRRGEVCGQSQE